MIQIVQNSLVKTSKIDCIKKPPEHKYSFSFECCNNEFQLPILHALKKLRSFFATDRT